MSDKYAINIGRAIINLRSLEFIMRVYLIDMELKDSDRKTENLFNLREGDLVEENALTNYDSLTRVIEKYNDAVSLIDEDLKVDPDIVNLRDGIAHGRIVAQQPNFPTRLYKFSKPEQGKVKVTHAIEMNEEWLADQVVRTFEELKKVQAAVELFKDKGKLA